MAGGERLPPEKWKFQFQAMQNKQIIQIASGFQGVVFAWDFFNQERLTSETLF